MGLINFYRRFLPHAARVLAPLNVYQRGAKKNDRRKIVWTPDAEAAFAQVKEDLANAVLLWHPAVDADTRIITDASDTAMGASLEQRIDNAWKPLGFQRNSLQLSAITARMIASSQLFTRQLDTSDTSSKVVNSGSLQTTNQLFLHFSNGQAKLHRARLGNYHSYRNSQVISDTVWVPTK